MHSGGGGAAVALVQLVFGVAIYVYYAMAFQTIAKKTNTPNDVWAWIPIVNLWLLVQISGKEAWWMILFFIPVANFVACAVVMMPIAEKLGKPNWWGILFAVPCVQIIVPGYLAWG